MPSEVILPRVDMDMTTGKIAKWFVESGAAVVKGQPLFEIETDKAAMEIEAPASGTIRDLAAASGTDIPVGSVVAWIFGDGEAAQPAPAARPTEAAEPVASAAVPTQPPAGATIIAPATASASKETLNGGAAPYGDKPRATPMARRLARSGGVDLATLTGSGPRGRIQSADVAAASTRQAPASPAIPSPPSRSGLHEGSAMAAVAAPAPVTAPAPAAARPAVRPTAGTINVVSLREGTGRPLLLVHGFGAEANGWRPMLAGYDGERPILALDLPGHGASPLDAVADFAGLVDAVEAGLHEAAIGPVDLVGHSLGGAVAAALAARGSLDVRSLVLVAPAGLVPAVNGAFVDGFLRATSEASLTPWMHELVSDPTAITPAFVRATLKARQGTTLVASQRRIADAVFPDGTQAFSIRGDLSALSIPTRIIVGLADRIIPAGGVDGLSGRIAVHRFPGVGHMPQIEVRAAIQQLLKDAIGH